MKGDLISYENLCRFCMGTGSASILDKNASLGGRTIAAFISSITLFKIDLSHQYPTQICQKCLVTITSFYAFMKHSEACQDNFKKLNTVELMKVPSLPLKEVDHNYAVRCMNLIMPKSKLQYESNSKDFAKASLVESPIEGSSVVTEETDPIQSLECYYCMKIFKKKSYIRNHIRTMHLEEPDGGHLVCSVCGKLIKGHANMRAHIKGVHEKSMVDCTVCGANMSSKALTRHMLSHGEDVSQKYLCKLCGRVLKSLKSLERHEKIHKDIRDFVCPECGASFAMKTNFNNHMRRHSGAPPKLFRCDLCDKAFRGQHTLKRHRLIHSGIKPFSCSSCEKSFYTSNELKTHERHHQLPVDKECVYCGKMFRTVASLRLHIMAHKNIRPHSCDICGKSFILRKKLTKHKLARHKVATDNTKLSWKDPQTYLTLNQLLKM